MTVMAPSRRRLQGEEGIQVLRVRRGHAAVGRPLPRLRCLEHVRAVQSTAVCQVNCASCSCSFHEHTGV